MSGYSSASRLLLLSSKRRVKISMRRKAGGGFKDTSGLSVYRCVAPGVGPKTAGGTTVQRCNGALAT